MAVASSERKVLKAIQEKGGMAGVTEISTICDFTSGYVHQLCAYLTKGGYLELTQWPGVYGLTAKAAKALGVKTALPVGGSENDGRESDPKARAARKTEAAEADSEAREAG